MIRAILLVLLFAAAPAWAAESARVVGVLDGDTITIVRAGRQERIRLYGIDAPENRQAYSRASAKTLGEMLRGKTVAVEAMETDRYGRTVARIWADGREVSAAMVAAGMAWVFPKYCRQAYCDEWRQAEQRARAAGVGLWRDKHPQPPWEWRRDEQQRLQQQQQQQQRRQYDRQRDVIPVGESVRVYRGNVKSRVFHAPGCRVYDCPNCIQKFRTQEEAIRSGYKPCGICGGL